MSRPEAPRPALVFVDLDGTLVRTDMLVESWLWQVRHSPLGALRRTAALSQGKAVLKERLAADCAFDPALLPYRAEVLDHLRARRAEGATIVLATASHRAIAERIAAHLGIFDGVIATEGGVNRSAARKLAAIDAWRDGAPFEYLGNGADDIAVWRASARPVVVAPEPAAQRWLRSPEAAAAERIDAEPAPRARRWAAALRLHQWLKNVLVFVPLLAAHRVFQLPSLAAALVAFVVFSLSASAIYLVNDLLDLEADRAHPRKRARPFAAGALPLVAGILACPLLLLAAFGLAAALLPGSFLVTIVLYVALTFAYSLWLKRRMVVDVIALAGLYTLRILAGAAAIGVAVSFWLLAFSVFLFLGLALVKRYAELRTVAELHRASLAGRDYLVEDMQVVMSLGTASAFVSVLVMALYVNSPEVRQLYARPEALWLLCPVLLYWLARVWMLAQRGQMHDDPVVFALRDRASRVCLLLGAAVVVGGTLGAAR